MFSTSFEVWHLFAKGHATILTLPVFTTMLVIGSLVINVNVCDADDSFDIGVRRVT